MKRDARILQRRYFRLWNFPSISFLEYWKSDRGDTERLELIILDWQCRLDTFMCYSCVYFGHVFSLSQQNGRSEIYLKFGSKKPDISQLTIYYYDKIFEKFEWCIRTMMNYALIYVYVIDTIVRYFTYVLSMYVMLPKRRLGDDLLTDLVILFVYSYRPLRTYQEFHKLAILSIHISAQLRLCQPPLYSAQILIIL